MYCQLFGYDTEFLAAIPKCISRFFQNFDLYVSYNECISTPFYSMQKFLDLDELLLEHNLHALIVSLKLDVASFM